MKKEMVFVLIALSLISFASAEMFVSQPDSIYNVGDKIPIKVTIRPAVQSEGYLSVQVKCDSESTEVFRNYYSLNSGEERIVDSIYPVTNATGGNCYIFSSFGADNVESIRFKVSNEISVSANFQKRIYDPGEMVRITGEAKKTNGQNVEGFVELTGDSIGNPIYGVVSGGKFAINYSASKEVSGVKSLRIYVYEKDNNGKVTNNGEYMQDIEIRPVLSEIEIILSSDSINPGDEITYGIKMFDQEGKEISGESVLTIVRPDGIEFLRDLSNKSSFNFITEKDYMPGYWKIESNSGAIAGKKLLYIAELQEASFNIVNGTILIKNVGNVPYKKAIKFKIGENEVVREINLAVGESKKFEVSAPDGDYNIEISDGTKGVSLGMIPLTGKSVELGEVKGIKGILEGNGILFVFIVIILGLFVGIFGYRNGYFPQSSVPKIPNQVEPSSVMGNGVSQNASVICLEIRSGLNGEAVNTVEKLIESAKSKGASVHVNGEHRVLLFAPITTKTNDNLQIAMREAKEMEDSLNSHNRRYRDKVNFGISVNHGDIIAERRNGELNFISRGSLIREAKRLASGAKNEILFSDISHRGLVQNADFIKDESRNAWRLGRIKGSEKYKEFIDNFKEKNFEKK